MKKILLSGLLSSTMLLAIPFDNPLLNGDPHNEVVDADASLLCSNAPVIPEDGLGKILRLSGGAITNHQGIAERYRWVSFELPVKSTVKISTAASYDIPKGAYRWQGLYNNECDGRAIAEGEVIETVLEAGTYKVAIHDKVAEYGIKGTSISYTPVEEYVGDPASQLHDRIDAEIMKERVGGVTSNDALLLSNAGVPVYTLHLTHATSWKGKAQRYAWYSFDIEEDTHSEIEVTAPDSGGSWIGIYNENGTLVADRWTAEGTHGLINVDLPKGNYRFFINKSGDDIDNARIHITSY